MRGGAMVPWRGVLLVLVATCCRRTAADDQDLVSLVNLVELEYDDQCHMKGEADWRELLGEEGALLAKLEQDKAVSYVRRNQYDLKLASADYVPGAPQNQLLDRKLELLLMPGDKMLSVDQWTKLVSYADEAAHRLETSTDYDCGGDPNQHCSLSDVRLALASARLSAGARRRVKASWETKLPDVNEYVSQVLPLLNSAAAANGYDSVEQYWEALVEYEGAVSRARELWRQLQPLYHKLHRHVSSRLLAAGRDVNTDTTIPVTSLGSLLGEDWLSVADLVLPKHADIYELIQKNLRQKNMGGREAFVKASRLISELGLGNVSDSFWRHSAFDRSCPARLVSLCVAGAARVRTCSDVSLANYLDAHETLFKVKYKKVQASFSNNTHILREPDRYSGVYEAVSGLGSLLALTPTQLDRAKLVPLKYSERNPHHNRLVLQMLMALRDLPRLSYYLSADEWRLQTLGAVPAPLPLGDSWSLYRRTHSLLQTGHNDFLGDPHILLNKPYLAEFFGLILKYQIYQSFDDYSNGDIVAEIAKNRHRILEPMTRAYSVKWPEVVSDILAKKEYGVEASGVTEYFSLLSDYLDKSEHSNEIAPAFEDPEPSDLFDTTNEPPPDDTADDTADERLNEVDNIGALETGAREKEDIKLDSENVQANKHLIAKEDLAREEATAPLQNQDSADGVQQAASGGVYMWVGIGIVLAIIVILVGVIVKKRLSHRKQLERERKQHASRA